MRYDRGTSDGAAIMAMIRIGSLRYKLEDRSRAAWS